MKNLFFALLFSILFVSNVFCAPNNAFNKKVSAAMSAGDQNGLKALFKKKSFESSLDPDLAYFVGMHFQEMNDEATAKKLFDFGWKRGTGNYAKLCAEKRISLSESNVPISIVERYVDSFPGDAKGKVALAKAYFAAKNWKKVLQTVGAPAIGEYSKPPQIRTTDSVARKNMISEQLAADNECSRMRVFALLYLDDPRFCQYVNAWATCWTISQEHVKFYNEWQDLPERLECEKKFGKSLLQSIYILQMRINVFERNYAKAVDAAKLAAPTSKNLPAVSYLDFCNAYFFNAPSNKELKSILETNLKSSKDAQIKFHSNFYLGRLAVRAKTYSRAQVYFRAAMKIAPLPENYDRALWHYLDTALKISFDSVLAALYNYGKTLNSPEYFEDFFQNLSLSLLTERRWNDYVRVFNTISDFSVGEAAAQFAYVSARLMEEGLAKNPNRAVKDSDAIKSAYQKAFDISHSNLYYRVLAASKLEIPIESVEKSFYKSGENPEFVENVELETLLVGLARYGFADRVFAEFIKDYHNVSIECAKNLADLLYAQGNKSTKLYLHSLRLLSYAARRTDQPITESILRGLYPRPYLKELAAAASKYSLSEYVLYGLTRTESFFQRDIRSRAGAIGLTQLMPSTARDVAKALNYQTYSLYDAQTNLFFGGYYLSEMIRRLDNTTILGLFAYNGGITRVRTWLKKNPEMPLDIFLELVPIAETRDYGRQVLSAAVLYGYLYYGVGYNKIVNEIMRKP